MDPWSLRQGGSSGRGPSFPSIFLASLFIGSEKYYAWKKKPLPKEKEPLDHEGTKEPLLVFIIIIHYSFLYPLNLL